MTNSVHDIGGMHGFGPIPLEENEPLFHEPWEARIFGTLMCSMGLFGVTLDNVRSRMEHIPPVTYLETPYYAKWLMALEDMTIGNGVASRDELTALAEGKDVPLEKDMDPIPTEGLLAYMAAGESAARQIETKAQFHVGDTVRAKNLNPDGHTRLPRYARGRVGTVIADCGGQIYPEVSARLEGDGPERLYTVQFKATELWGPSEISGANPNDTVCIDLWEPYLEAAS
jgi:nitrile hydratase beta subunit